MRQRAVTIFGGSGFLGRHLVRRLAPSGALIRIAVRDPEAAKFLKPLGDVGQIVPIHADLRAPATLARALEGADAAVNLVGILFERRRRDFARIHVEGAAHIGEAAAAAGVRRLVQVSALGADPASASAYARSKAAGEAAVRAAFPGATILRPAAVFGPEDQFFNRFGAMARLVPILPVFYAGLPKIDPFTDFPWPRISFGAGANRMQPVYVGDVARALARVLDDPETAGRTFELGGPTVYAMAELMALVFEQIGRPGLLAPVPYLAAYPLALFLEQAVIPFRMIGKDPAPLITRDQLKLLRVDNLVAPGARGLADLGIAPTALEAILPTYLQRYRSRPLPRSENPARP